MLPKFRIHLVLERKDDILIYSISKGFRFVFSSLALVILISLIFTESMPLFNASNIFPLILMLICILASLYNERWIFNRRMNIYEENTGLVFISRRKQYRLDSLEKVELSVLYKGGIPDHRKKRYFSKALIAMILYNSEGKAHKLNIVNHIHIKEIRDTAKCISEFCDIPLEDRTAELPE